jgi:hypothetical protein
MKREAEQKWDKLSSQPGFLPISLYFKSIFEEVQKVTVAAISLADAEIVFDNDCLLCAWLLQAPLDE